MGSIMASTEDGDAVGVSVFPAPTPPRGREKGVGEAVGLEVFPVPTPPRGAAKAVGEAVGLEVFLLLPTLPEATGEDEGKYDDEDNDGDVGADEKLPPRFAAVGAAVGEPALKVGLG